MTHSFQLLSFSLLTTKLTCSDRIRDWSNAYPYSSFCLRHGQSPPLFITYSLGYIGTSYHMHDGGGSNYLCLPEQPKYNKYDTTKNSKNRAYMYGTEFELGDSAIFDTSVKSGQYFDALCSVCEVKSRSNSIMVPATTECPAGWRREYHGYLMAQKSYLKRTEYICVDHQPDLTIGTENWGKGALLHFVETRCGILPCNSGQYQEYWELSCAVCTR